jgi:hypothetical protein
MTIRLITMSSLALLFIHIILYFVIYAELQGDAVDIIFIGLFRLANSSLVTGVNNCETVYESL